MMNATPPKGVIIPSDRLPVTASTYRLPEKNKDAANRQPSRLSRSLRRKGSGARQHGYYQDSHGVQKMIEDGFFVDTARIIVQAIL